MINNTSSTDFIKECQQRFKVIMPYYNPVISCNLVRITDLAHRSLLVDYAVENGATARTTAAWFQAWQVGENLSNPGEIEPVEGQPSLPPVIPYTPCVICGNQQKMAHLSYMPVCAECSEIVLATAREVRKRE